MPTAPDAPRAAGRPQLPRPPWTAVAVALAAGVALAALAPLGQLVTGGSVTAVELISDPAETNDITWFAGGVASLNMFLWAAASALCAVGAAGLWRAEPRLARALGALALLSTVILVDDRFLLHELVLPHYGLPEPVSYVAYALAGALYVIAFWRVLSRHQASWLLALALVGMGLSVLLDMTGIDSDVRRVAEESAKMVGAAALVGFPALILVRRLRRADR